MVDTGQGIDWIDTTHSHLRCGKPSTWAWTNSRIMSWKRDSRAVDEVGRGIKNILLQNCLTQGRLAFSVLMRSNSRVVCKSEENILPPLSASGEKRRKYYHLRVLPSRLTCVSLDIRWYTIGICSTSVYLVTSNYCITVAFFLLHESVYFSSRSCEIRIRYPSSDCLWVRDQNCSSLRPLRNAFFPFIWIN